MTEITSENIVTGYSTTKRKNHYADPDGFVFKFGRKQTDGTISLIYCSRKESLPTSMPYEKAMKILSYLGEQKEEDPGSNKRVKDLDETYRPGSLGYHFAKTRFCNSVSENNK